MLGHIEVETNKFIRKARQRKDRNRAHSPDMGVGAMSALTSGCLMEKKYIGVWLKFALGKVLPFVLTLGIISFFCC
jgi:hypothetical protein